MNEYNKYFPETLTLETPRVKLRLMGTEDFDALKGISGVAEIWKYFTKNLAIDEELRKWIAEALEERARKRMPFVVIDRMNRRFVDVQVLEIFPSMTGGLKLAGHGWESIQWAWA
jgi:hypothetical protein